MIILASESPRRKEILEKLLIEFKSEVSFCDESLPNGINPEEACVILAKRKAESVFKENPEDIVIGADTMVVLDNNILGKPSSKEEATDMLKKLSGRSHFVFTGVSIISKDKSMSFYDKTEVKFSVLSDEDINFYISTDEPYDKAGSYAIQGIGCRFIEKINGDFYTVMGLPSYKLIKALKVFINLEGNYVY